MPIIPVGGGGTSGLPSNWQNLPTTEQSLEAAVGIIDQRYGAALGAQFETWYRQVWARAPKVTPNQATVAWVAGESTASAVGQVGGVVAGVPGAAAAGAQNVANSPLGQAAHAVDQAWNAATAIPRFLSMLTNPNLWLRIGEVVAGLILLGIGVNALFHGKPMSTVTNVAGKVAKVVPV